MKKKNKNEKLDLWLLCLLAILGSGFPSFLAGVSHRDTGINFFPSPWFAWALSAGILAVLSPLYLPIQDLPRPRLHPFVSFVAAWCGLWGFSVALKYALICSTFCLVCITFRMQEGVDLYTATCWDWAISQMFPVRWYLCVSGARRCWSTMCWLIDCITDVHDCVICVSRLKRCWSTTRWCGTVSQMFTVKCFVFPGAGRCWSLTLQPAGVGLYHRCPWSGVASLLIRPLLGGGHATSRAYRVRGR